MSDALASAELNLFTINFIPVRNKLEKSWRRMNCWDGD
jgi:hypothetical protein